MAVVAKAFAMDRVVYVPGAVVPDELATAEKVALGWFVVDDDDVMVETSTAAPGEKRSTRRRNRTKHDTVKDIRTETEED